MQTAVDPKIVKTTATGKTIYERRAIRRYKDSAVSRDLIGQLLEAGRMAPSAMNKQPWHFYVLTDKDTIHAFSREIAAMTLKDTLHAGISGVKQVIKAAAGLLHFSHGINLHAVKDPVFHGAPVVIFLTADRNNEWAPLDIGMCAQNIMLAAKAIGLDSCPIGFGKFVEKTNSYPRLHIPPSEKVQLAIIIGYGDESPAAHERSKDNALFID